MNRLIKQTLLFFLNWLTLAACTHKDSNFENASNFRLAALEECFAVSVKFSTIETNATEELFISTSIERRRGEAMKIFITHFNPNMATAEKASLCTSSFRFNNNSFENYETRTIELTIENVDLPNSSFLYPINNVSRLERLSLVNTKLIGIPDNLFENLSNLRSLVITGNQIERITSETFRGLPQLQELILSNNSLKDLSSDCFIELVNLEELRLDNNQILNLKSETFTNNKHLRFVNLTKHNNNPGMTVNLNETIFKENLYLETIVLKNNHLYEMHPKIFANLTRLKSLDLSSNSFQALNPEWLRDLHNLETLSLFGNIGLGTNPIHLGYLKNLKTLDLGMCGLKILTSESFAGMENLDTISLHLNNLRNVMPEVRLFQNNSKLRVVHLNNSNISRFNANWFLNLTKLESVNLRCNYIDNLSYRDLFQLIPKNNSKNLTLDFAGNKLTRLFFRSSEKLRHTKGSSGTILMTMDSFSNNSLQCDLEFIQSYMKKQQNILLMESDSKVECGRLRRGSKGLRSLPACDCEGEYFPCSCSYDNREKSVTLNCQEKLKHYFAEGSLRNWRLPLIEPYQDYSFKIDLSYNGIKNLPQAEWQYDSRVTHLDLSENYLDTQAFQTLNLSRRFPQLLNMNLSKNKIQGIPMELLTFLNESRDGRDLTLHLEGNPLVCDCNDIPWLENLKSNLSETIVGFEYLDCSFRGAYTSLSWAVNNLTYNDACKISNNESLILTNVPVLMICFIVVMVIVILTAFFWFAVRRNIRQQQFCFEKNLQVELEAPLLKYDAFISYSHKDEEFVINELVPNLENPDDGSPKYRLCLHERDWLAGEWIVDQISQSIATSQQTIIILSENFIESFWGKHEFRVAYQQVIHTKQRRLIVIIKDELPDLAPLDEDLRLFIANNTYLKWSDPSFWRRLREALAPNYVQKIQQEH